jgi:hypothetical protein
LVLRAWAQEAEQTDMQLAWSMLEVAKLIFSRDRDANALDLAGARLRVQAGVRLRAARLEPVIF